MKFYKETSVNQFRDIPNFEYQTNFMSQNLGLPRKYDGFRIAYVDQNKSSTKGTLLFIHGFPTWSFLWRHLVSYAITKEYRVIAIDLPGFGKSDKPTEKDFFTFVNYRNVLLNFIKNLNLENITLFLHDWGGTLGLTLPMENPTLYKGLACFSTYLGNNHIKISDSYSNWLEQCSTSNDLNVRALMARTNRILNLSECNAYEAPFPDTSYKLALKEVPSIFPLNDTKDGFSICKEAEQWWQEEGLENTIMLGGAKDPIITIDKIKMLAKIVTSEGETHVINNAGHFVPEWGMEFGNELFEHLEII